MHEGGSRHAQASLLQTKRASAHPNQRGYEKSRPPLVFELRNTHPLAIPVPTADDTYVYHLAFGV